MNRHAALPYHQRGVAVITALLLTTLAITIVASLFWQQQVQVRSIENQRLQLQKQWILRGALDWARLILREDAKHSTQDTLDEPWAVPLAETRLDQYIENGRSDTDASDATLSGSISDAQARFNLTNLCVNGIINPDEVANFERLLNSQKFDTQLAQATAQLMAAAQKKPADAALKQNAEPVAQPINLTQVDDLLAIQGFTPGILETLKDWVIFLPKPTPINVNTTSAEVLAAKFSSLTLADAKALIVSRDTTIFRDLTDFQTRLPGKNIPATAGDASVATNYFLVNGHVRMSRAELNMQALIERDTGLTKLIWIREY